MAATAELNLHHATRTTHSAQSTAPEHGRRLLALLAQWMERQHSRRQLASLDERLLRDVGISRADARMEARRPFWR